MMERQYFNFGKGHVKAAVIAIAISVVIHIGFTILAMNVNMDMNSAADLEKTPRKYDTLKLESVQVAPEVNEKVLDALRSVGKGVMPETDQLVEDKSVKPEEGITEPETIDNPKFAGDDIAMAEPEPPPPMAEIMPPPREILEIENRAVGDTVSKFERHVIPKLERVSDAPDMILPPSSQQLAIAGASGNGSAKGITAPGTANIVRKVVGGMDSTAKLQAPVISKEDKDAGPDGKKELFSETLEEVTDVEPIERVLKASIQTYASSHDKKYGYFKLNVERAGSQLLPVLPKDIILVQDCSASMSEKRLYFCREGLRRALAHIGPSDRFNIAKFADNTETCFPDWVRKTPANLDKAEDYINSMVANGNTDLFTSMSDLLKLPATEGRPIIAFVITDGLVNKGITDNSAIIGEFTRKNAGKISVFTLGTSQLANLYLVDLLSYCNKGYVNVISKGRWDIPDSIERVMQGIRRPVLADLRVQIPDGSSCEMYPSQVSNLYLDRPLVLYGRYRRGERQLIFQAVGHAGATACDMIFDLPLDSNPVDTDDRKNQDIRKKWAQRKIYHLIGEYTRTKDKAILLEMRRTARKYKEPIPYKRRFF